MHAIQLLVSVLSHACCSQHTFIIFTEEEDFPETSNTLVFPPGSGSQQECAAFPVIDDDITEGDESFTVSLSSLLPSISIAVDEASVEIVDDDSM